MNKLFEVKEFDRIICNSDYKDDVNYRYLDKKHFENLETFIREFSGNNADILDFMGIGYCRDTGKIITVKNYVGLIQLKDGFQIQVLPKISFEDEEDINNAKTKNIFLHMLCSMKDFPGKVFNNASLKIQHMSIYEIFINMYLQEVRRLVKRGIKSSYVRQEDNLKY